MTSFMILIRPAAFSKDANDPSSVKVIKLAVLVPLPVVMVLQDMNTSLLQLSVFLEQKQKNKFENLQNVGMNKEVFFLFTVRVVMYTS